RHICSVRSAPNAEPAPPSCCRPAILKLCSFTSMRSQPKSLRALTLLFSSIKPGGMAPRPSRFQTTFRSCSFRHAHPNSTAKKISGNSRGRTGYRTEFSNPSTTLSIPAATPGTRPSISRGKLCLSPAAIGQPQVTQSEDWYNLARSCFANVFGSFRMYDPRANNIQYFLGIIVSDSRLRLQPPFGGTGNGGGLRTCNEYRRHKRKPRACRGFQGV